MARRRDSEREQLWQQRFARWSSSGRTVRAFCATEGIPESAWYYWRGELERRSAGRAKRRSAAPAFVPVTVLPTTSVVVEIRCPSGHVVMLPGMDEAALRLLFAALAAPPSC